MANYKPAGHSTVSPYLVLDGAAATVDFLVEVFAAEVLVRLEGDGRIHHAEVKIEDSVIMLADAPPGMGPVTGNLHVYVPDVDATYAKALAAGATSIQEPMKKDDPDRRGGVRDGCGNAWWIGTRVE